MARTNTNQGGDASLTGDNGISIDSSVIKLGGNPLIEDTIVDINNHSMIFQGQAPGFPAGETMFMGSTDDLFGFGFASYGIAGTHTLNSLDFQFLNNVQELNPGVQKAHYLGFIDISGANIYQATTGHTLVDDVGDFSPRIESVAIGYDDLGSETTVYQGIEMREAGFVHISDLDFTQNRVRIRKDRAEVNYDYDDGNVIETGSASARSGESYLRSTYEDATLGINNRAYFNARGLALEAEMKVQDDVFGTNNILIGQNGTYLGLLDVERMRLTETEGTVMSGTFQEKKGNDILVGNKIDIPVNEGNCFYVSGTGATIQTMKNLNWQDGSEVVLWIGAGNVIENLAAVTPTTGFTKLRLINGSNITTTTDTMITFRLWNGTWTQSCPIAEL